MKLHEYQGKQILKKYGVAVPRGEVAFTIDEAVKAAEKIGGSEWIVKAQIHAGGRYKSGGVKLARSFEEVREYAGEIFNMRLVTHQTGPEGRIVHRVLVEQRVHIAKEIYAGITLDQHCSKNVLMVSTEGGSEIEKVAAKTPKKILKEMIDPVVGLQKFQACALCSSLGLMGEAFRDGVRFLIALCTAYEACDAILMEINPLVLTQEGHVLALDAKIHLDDNALFRHPEFEDLRDIDEEDPLEVEASASNLHYMKLDGNVGCMVNGAGLAMATMDIIKLAGGKPANFLDVGGSASAQTVEAGFKIILKDEHVKAILINIFGGIVRCDRVASGVVEAAKNVGVQIPIVIRLAGTHAVLAAKILKNSRLKFLVANNFKEAAEKVTQAIAA